MKFAALLKQQFEASEFRSQRAFARAARVSPQLMGQYLTGKKKPSNERFAQLINALDIQNTKQHKELGDALVREREASQAKTNKRSYGVAATLQLAQAIRPGQDFSEEERLDALLAVFYANTEREPDDALDFQLRLQFRNILKKDYN